MWSAFRPKGPTKQIINADPDNNIITENAASLNSEDNDASGFEGPKTEEPPKPSTWSQLLNQTDNTAGKTSSSLAKMKNYVNKMRSEEMSMERQSSQSSLQRSSRSSLQMKEILDTFQKDDKRYGVTFGPGSLGITLQPTRCGRGVYIQDIMVQFCKAVKKTRQISAVGNDVDSSASSVAGEEFTFLEPRDDVLFIGDRIVEIGEEDVSDRELTEVLDLIMTLTGKDVPLEMLFRRSDTEGMLENLTFMEVMEDPRKVPILFHFLMEDAGETGSAQQAKMMFWLEATQYYDQWPWLRPGMRKVQALRIARKFFGEGCPFDVSTGVKDKQIENLLAKHESLDPESVTKDLFISAQKAVQQDLTSEGGCFQTFLGSPWAVRMIAHLEGSPHFIPLDFGDLFGNSASFCTLELHIMKFHPYRMPLLKCWRRITTIIDPLARNAWSSMSQKDREQFLEEASDLWNTYLAPKTSILMVEVYPQTRQKLQAFEHLLKGEATASQDALKQLVDIFLQVASELFATLAGEVLPVFFEGDMYESFCKEVADFQKTQELEASSRESSPRINTVSAPRKKSPRVTGQQRRSSATQMQSIGVRKGFLSRMVRAAKLSEDLAVHRVVEEEKNEGEKNSLSVSGLFSRVKNRILQKEETESFPESTSTSNERSNWVSPVDWILHFNTENAKDDKSKPQVKITSQKNVGSEDVELPHKLEDFLVPHNRCPLYRSECPRPKLFNLILRGKEHSLLYGACLLFHYEADSDLCGLQTLSEILTQSEDLHRHHTGRGGPQEPTPPTPPQRQNNQQPPPPALFGNKPLFGKRSQDGLTFLERLRAVDVPDLLSLTPQKTSTPRRRSFEGVGVEGSGRDEDSSSLSSSRKLSSIGHWETSSLGQGAKKSTQDNETHSEAKSELDLASSLTPFFSTGVCIISQFPLVNKLRMILSEFYSENQGAFFEVNENNGECVTAFGVDGEDTERRVEKWSSLTAADLQLLLEPLYFSHKFSPSKYFSELQDDFDLNLIFRCLSVENILNVFISLLTENKVILHSNNYSTLTIVGEIFRSFLEPLGWCHIYVPLLPSCMEEQLLQCPTPYFIGVTSDFSEGQEEVVSADLDTNEVYLPSDFCGVTQIFSKLSKELEDLIYPSKHLCDNVSWTGSVSLFPQVVDSHKVTSLFQGFTHTLIKDAHFAITALNHENEKLLLFDQQAFIRLKETQFDVTAKNNAEEEFLSLFMQTQSFSSHLTSMSKSQQSSFASSC